jgi:hypothetical protein
MLFFISCVQMLKVKNNLQVVGALVLGLFPYSSVTLRYC